METRICRLSGKTFTVTDRDIEFYNKIGVPPPTLCPEEMARTRLSFRNEVDLYKRKCDKTEKPILTYYPPDAPYPIYENETWWGDSWNPLNYGQKYDPTRSFFDQLTELYNKVPKSNIYVVDSENCDYTNYATHNKNCYLIFGSWKCENCIYGNTYLTCLNCLDCQYVDECRWCYECVDCNYCYETFYSQNSLTCIQSWFLFDCRRCENCIGCWNLRDKKYYVWNKPVTKEEYEKISSELKTSYKTVCEFNKKFREHIKNNAIHKYMTGENNENASGNFIYNSKNVKESYTIQNSEDIAYSDRTNHMKDQYFCTGTHEGNLTFNTVSVDYSHTVICGMNGEYHSNTAYCADCYSIESCFGCFGLRHKKYCILNKEYSREAFNKLRLTIIENMTRAEEWGEYFPMKMNKFCFNKTVAFDYFPLTKEEAVKRGYKWKDEAAKSTVPQNFELPDNVQEANEKVCEQLLVCEETGKNYRVVPQELAFLKRMGLPLPRKCWEKRYSDRIALRTPRILFKRTCSKCNDGIFSTYSAQRTENVYCEKCYLGTVY